MENRKTLKVLWRLGIIGGTGKLNYRELLDIASRYTPGYEVYDLATSMIARHGLDSEEAIAGIFALLLE